MRSFGLHPFFFYGICWIISRVAFNKTKEVQTEGIDDLLNEMNVNMIERLSVISASLSNGMIGHDDHLRHISVDGVPLSLIRKFKQNPDSVKSEILLLRDSVIKRSKVDILSKTVSLMDLKENIINKT